MKRDARIPGDAELRAAHAGSELARIPFEKAMADKALAICIRNLAEARARRVPAPVEAFQLTP